MSADIRAQGPEVERLKGLARAAQRGIAEQNCTPVEAVFALSLALAEACRQADAEVTDVMHLVRSMHRSMVKASMIVGAAPQVDVVGAEAFEALAKKVGI